MKTFGQIGLYLFFVSFAYAQVDLPVSGVVSEDKNDLIDPKIDYEKFSGRVTDKDDQTRIFKVKTENNNVKFFRSGDLVEFKLNTHEGRDFCQGFVRAVEDFYFSIYVDSLSPCFSSQDYFKRGTVLQLQSKILAERVFDASKYRGQLFNKKADFLKQLNQINHFVWTFEQQKVKTAARYDEEISRLQKEKRKALDDLVSEKMEKLVLQNELMKKLNELDESLKFYRIERQELMTDRWNSDHDSGLPFGERPQEPNKQ